jgi:hypothetical protein
MTAQINDLFIYKGEEFSIAGISEEELFVPQSVGLNPSMASTACWRGYQAIYSLQDSRLVLQSLLVKLVKGDCQEMHPVLGPAIGNTAPIQTLEHVFFNNLYENLKLPLQYSGGILLAAGFIQNLYVHMGFHPAWKYERVMELSFEDGVLQSAENKSRQMKEFRDSLDLQSASTLPREPTKEAVQAFVERAFRRRY